MGAKNGHSGTGAIQRVIVREQHLAAMQAGKAFLAIQQRTLNHDELRLVYENVYPTAVLSEADERLQQRQVMSPETVTAELGPEIQMQATYNYLIEQMHFLSAGNRPHNIYTDLPRHSWDTAYRAFLMGLSVELRQLALIHSFPEHKARGLMEGRKIVAALRGQFGAEVADGLELLTDWNGILVDHLSYRQGKIGRNDNSTSQEDLKKLLEGISRKDERRKVAMKLEEVLKLPAGSKKRLIPAGEGLVYPEVKARLHTEYVDTLARHELTMLQQSPGYDNAPLIVKGLCLIDRLRTADGVTQAEKATRETADFLPALDTVLTHLHRQSRVNNVVEFVSVALKTEYLTELDQRAAQARSMRDTKFARIAEQLDARLVTARKHYGEAAGKMGYVPVQMLTRF